LLGGSESLGLVHLRAQLQTLRHTRLGASFLQPGDRGTVLAFVSVVAFACAVEAQAVVVALVQLRTRLQAAIVTRPAGLAVTSVRVTVAIAVTGAAIGTFLLGAGGASKVGGAEAGAVEASTVGLVASIGARADGAIHSLEARIAMALLAPLITHAIAGAGIGTQVNLGLALQPHKARWTQAIALVAATAIVRTVASTRLVAARRAFPANLAQARRVVPAIAVLAVRTHRLGAVDATVANVALALAGHSVAATMARASIGTHLLLARLAHEPRRTIAHAIHTATV